MAAESPEKSLLVHLHLERTNLVLRMIDGGCPPPPAMVAELATLQQAILAVETVVAEMTNDSVLEAARNNLRL